MAFFKIFRLYNFAGFGFSLRANTACHKKFFHSHNTLGKAIYNMRTAYFEHADGDENVQVALTFNDSNLSRVLHFQRPTHEKLVNFLKKLDTKITTLKIKKHKKCKAPIEDLPEINSVLLLNDEQVSDNFIFQDIFQSDFSGDLKLRILDADYEVIINAPTILKMDFPKSLLVGCLVVPENVNTKFMDLTQSEFTWYKSKFPNKNKSWEKCGEGFYYNIKEDDLEYYLKLSCIPKLNERVGPVFEIISQSKVVKLENLYEIHKRQAFTRERTKENEFRIVTYNVLADFYAHTKEAKFIFQFCNPEYLEYDYRKNLLIFELQGYNADIFCMQEVTQKFFDLNQVLFASLDYDGLYHKKEVAREGFAIFYNKNKFRKVTSKQYIFTAELLSNPLFSDIKLKIENKKNLVEKLLNVTSQIQVTVLECVENNILVIGNVHFYFHPTADHIRLLQGVMSLRILLNTVEELKKMKPNHKISIVLCGDFNTTPECGFHQLLTEGSLDSNHFEWKSEDEIIEDVSCSHSLKMRSCYNHDIFTSYIPSFKGCIDYIYFQCDHLELKQSVPVPSEEVLSKFQGIPSQYFPSDHLALIADLKFKDFST